jgi:hypothetical protein
VTDNQLDYRGIAYETCDAGTDNGKPGKCNATCSGDVPPTPTPIPGVCSTTVTGVQSSPIVV